MSSTSVGLLDLLRQTPVVETSTLDTWLRANENAASLPAETVALAMVRDSLLTRYQAEQILRGRGKLLVLRNKYLVVDLIGSGGMGKVYLCRHMILNRLVAVKMLPTNKVDDPEILERFTNEARVVAALKHRNIIQMYDIEMDEKMPLMVMEYAEGRDLDRLVRRNGPIDPDSAAHFIAQAACGLEHANGHHLVHRDIKPSNLILDRFGVVRILDMGLARFSKADSSPSITKKYNEASILGTAEYLSPEQALSSNVDIRADIYSLGATFHFLLTGKPPFQEENISQKLMAHQMKPVPSARATRPEVPHEMDLIMQRMLAKKVQDRFQTPLEVVRALSPYAVRAQAGMHETIERLLGKSLIPRGVTVSASFDMTGSNETMPVGRSVSTMPLEPAQPALASRSRTVPIVLCASIALAAFAVIVWQLTSGAGIPPKLTPTAVAAPSHPEPAIRAFYTPDDVEALIDLSSVTIRMPVVDARGDESQRIERVYLSSSKNISDAKLLRVIIARDIWEASRSDVKMEALSRYFFNRTIIVTGRVTLKRGQYELLLESADDIRRE